jgi:hypothetical protein
MFYPTVNPLPHRLEPTTHDPFIDGLAGTSPPAAMRWRTGRHAAALRWSADGAGRIAV